MIPVFVCDDQPASLQQIADIVQQQILIQALDMGPIYKATSPEALLKLRRRENACGIYFLDVDLEAEQDGFALAAKLREEDPRGYIIFVTGHPELSFQTFRYRLEAMDYIVKGDEEELKRRVQACLASVQQHVANSRPENDRYYTLKIFDTIRNIPLDDILYFEATGATHRVCLYTHKEVLEFFGSLQAVEDAVGDGFFRSHRAFLVNSSKVALIDLKNNQIQLEEGSVCPLARSAKKTLAKKMRENQ